MTTATDTITFEPLQFAHSLSISLIQRNGVDIGQERIYYGKPFSLDENGKLTVTEPIYQYVNFAKAVAINIPLTEGDGEYHMDEYDNPETGECEDGYAPYWNTLEDFLKHN